MRLILLILIILFILALLLGSNLLKLKNSRTLNPVEQKTAMWNDGTDAFYKQVLSSNGEWVENAGSPIFDNQTISSLPPRLAVEGTSSQVLGSHTAADGSEKWIEIDLSDFKLYAWEGNRKVYELLVSTGRPGYKTPTGEFTVWRKVRSQAYKGGSKDRGDYYYVPNVPYSLFIGGGNVPNSKGYAIHGAYWHDDFGIKNRSSGCVNVRPTEMAQLYNWAGPAIPDDVGAINATDDNPGIRVVIHD